MSIIAENDIIYNTLMGIAEKMLIAARTAPKARGIDNIEAVIIEGDTIKQVSDKMIEIGKECEMAAFSRDAQNILSAPVILLLGTSFSSIGLKKCGMCGFGNCETKEKNPNVPCVFNSGDLGIALGSAASVAMDNRVDNRIMYTVGQAALDLKIMSNNVKIIYGIPLSSSSKNIFFDRKE